MIHKVFFTIDNPRPNSPLIPLRNGVKIPSSKSLSMFDPSLYKIILFCLALIFIVVLAIS